MNRAERYNETIKRMANAGSITPILPPEYQQVEYIQTVTGNSSILFDVSTITNNAQFEIEMTLFQITANGKLFEARLNNSGIYLGLYNGVYYQLGTQGPGVYLSTTPTANVKFRIKADKGNVYQYDYMTRTYNSVGTFTPTQINVNQKMPIFCGHYNSFFDQYVNGRLYSFRYMDDGVPISDLIPCYRKVDGIVGLYNLVNDNFITARSGSFTVGNPV